MNKDKELYLWYGILLIVLMALAFNIYSFFDFKKGNDIKQPNINIMGAKLSMMSLTDFDKAKARQMMDKDNDGRCDFCGMPVEMCIDSGEMECGMNTNAKIGKLGSQHIHADWKIYIDGKQFDFTPFGDRHEKQMHRDTTIKDTSAFIHIHPANAPEKAGDILHMHATGIPLSLFFESIGINFDNKEIRLFVNGKENKDWKNYVFNDLDKILLTDRKGNIGEQLKSITDFAKVH